MLYVLRILYFGRLLLNRFDTRYFFAIIIICNYWACFNIFLRVLAGFSMLLPVCFECSKKCSFFVYFKRVLAYFRISLAVVAPIIHILKLVSSFELKNSSISFHYSPDQHQDIHLSMACLLYFIHKYFYSDEQGRYYNFNLLTLIIIMFTYMFQLINRS